MYFEFQVRGQIDWTKRRWRPSSETAWLLVQVGSLPDLRQSMRLTVTGRFKHVLYCCISVLFCVHYFVCFFSSLKFMLLLCLCKCLLKKKPGVYNLCVKLSALHNMLFFNCFTLIAIAKLGALGQIVFYFTITCLHFNRVQHFGWMRWKWPLGWFLRNDSELTFHLLTLMDAWWSSLMS